MVKTGRTILRVVFIGVILLFAFAKVFSIEAKSGAQEKRVRHVDKTTSEFDELW